MVMHSGCTSFGQIRWKWSSWRKKAEAYNWNYKSHQGRSKQRKKDNQKILKENCKKSAAKLGLCHRFVFLTRQPKSYVAPGEELPPEEQNEQF